MRKKFEEMTTEERIVAIDKSLRRLTICLVVLIVLLVLSIACPTKVHAQEPAAPVTTGHVLADAAMPSNVVMNAFIACMATEQVKEKTCKQLAEREAERSERVAKEARKASQPRGSFWNPPAGTMYRPIYGYGGYGYGPVYQRPQQQPAHTDSPRNNNRGQAVPRGSAYGGNTGGQASNSAGYGGNTMFRNGTSGSGVNGNGTAVNRGFLPGTSGSGANGNGTAVNRGFLPGASGHSGASGSGGNTNGTGGNFPRR